MVTAILSPHLDDAVLSCWHLLTEPHEVMVVNLFAGVPAAGAVTGWWDTSSGSTDSREAVMDRIEEDRGALALAGRVPLNLEFLDDQYRDAPAAVDRVLDVLRDALPRGAQVLAPAALAPLPEHLEISGAGREPHPDHMVARAAALALRAEGYPVALYADLPHASARGWPDWVTGCSNGRAGALVADAWRRGIAMAGIGENELVAEVWRLRRDAFKHKVEAVRHYKSQVPTIERAFGRRLDDPELLGYEVLWRLAAIASAA